VPASGRWAAIGALGALSLVAAGCARDAPSETIPATGPDLDLAALALERGANPLLVASIDALLERARKAGEPDARVEPLLALAMLARAGHDLDAAERHLAAAGEAASASTPPRLRGWRDCVAAAIALDRNRPEEAAALAERARREFRAAGETRGDVEAATLMIAARGMHQARFEEAFGLVEDCLASAAVSAEELLRLRCINARAALAYNLADYETAVGDYLEVAAATSPLPEKLKATARLNLALCHVHLGQYAAARLGIEQALAAAREPGRTEYPEAVPLYYRGYLLSRLGDHEGAFEDYLAALARFRREQNRYFESFLLIDIGDNLLRRGQPQRAIEEYEASLELYLAAGNPRGAMLVEEGIGRALLDLGDDPPAERRLRRALALAGEVGDDHGWARIAAVLGDRLLRRTAPPEAEALLARAVDVAAAKGLLEEQFRAMLGLARAWRDRSRHDAALGGYRAALGLLDRIRDQLSSESQHLTFSESRNVAYRETVDLLLEDPTSDAVAEAFAVAERARARAILELTQHARLAEATRAPERHRERLALLARLSRAQSALLLATDEGEPARAEFRRAGEELERFDLEEAASLPPAVHPRPLDLDAVRGRVTAGRTLAVFWIGPGRSCLWSIRDGLVRFAELADVEALVPAIEAYRAAIAHEPGWYNPAEAWRSAARALAPLLRIDLVLGGATGGTLLVVPDGPLHGVPLEPLIAVATDGVGSASAEGDPASAGRDAVSAGGDSTPAGGVPASAGRDPTGSGPRFDLVYLPSASFLAPRAPIAGTAPVPRLFALGDPRAPASPSALPGARDEVERVARVFGADRVELRLGVDATKDALRTPSAAAADILHVAARTVTPEQQPGATGIALAPGAEGGDGLLRPHEVAALTLRARLAVLSACGTGLGRPIAGEGLHGLATAFLIAGVPQIMASQWDVSDRATSELVERFYRGLATGEPAHRALARAARELRQESLPLYAHPYYWASFTLFGLPPPGA